MPRRTAPSLLVLAALILAGFPSAASAQPPGSSVPSEQFRAGEVLVRVEEGLLPDELNQIAQSVGARVQRRLTSWGVYLLTFDPQLSVRAMVNHLQALPGVRYAEPNALIPVNLLFGGGDPTGTLAAAEGVVVAVIDTGVDMTHPAFSGQIYTNRGEIAGDGLDNDGNGYVDDVHGWDFYEWDNDPSGGPEDGAHGTMVSGMVLQGALGAPLSILPLQVGPGPWLDLGAILEAIDYAVRQGARIINMSFGTSTPYQALTDAVLYAAQRGVMLVAAAGNSGSLWPSYPAALPGVVSVAASDATGRKTWWSNYGWTVDFTAPGDRVTTTDWGGGTATVSGTSFSSPFVAGVAARILASLPQLKPNEVVDRIKALAKDVYAYNPSFFRGLLGYGLVDGEVAQRVADAYPADGSGSQPPQEDERALLEAELAKARQEVARLEGELAAAEQRLSAAQQALTAAQGQANAAEQQVRDAWQGLVDAWRAYFRSFYGSTPAQREALRQKMNQAWDALYKSFAQRREAQARLRVAQAELTQARDRRNNLAGQLAAARQRVSDLERRLAQLSISGSVGVTAHQLQTEQLIQKMHAVTEALQRGAVPPGLTVQEVSELLTPEVLDSRRNSD